MIPPGTSTSRVRNTTNVCTLLTFANGTSRYFDDARCPQPLPPNLYNVTYPVVTDLRFIAAENGSTFIMDVSNTEAQGPYSVSFSNGTTHEYKALGFVLYSSPPDQAVRWCNGSMVPISWAIGQYNQVKGLTVLIPINPVDGSFNFSATEMRIEPGFNGFSCPSMAMTTTTT